MPFESHPHAIAVAIFVFALLVVLSIKNLRDPASVWTLISGILLVVTGALALSGFEMMMNFFNILHESREINIEQFQEGKQATKLWSLLLPAIVAAMGANFISSWALIRKTS